jgi:hypothetical protein
VGGNNGIEPPIVVACAGNDGKCTSDRHAAGLC